MGSQKQGLAEIFRQPFGFSAFGRDNRSAEADPPYGKIPLTAYTSAMRPSAAQ